jgi:hypothetical protein
MTGIVQSLKASLTSLSRGRIIYDIHPVAEQKVDQPTGVHPYGSCIVTDRTCNTSILCLI